MPASIRFEFLLLPVLFIVALGQTQSSSTPQAQPWQTKPDGNVPPLPGFGPPIKFQLLPVCKCDAIEKCREEMDALRENCSVNPTCEEHLKGAGDPIKVRACMKAERAQMAELEQCVRSKAGPLGCSNSSEPLNITVPIMQFPPPPQARGGHDPRMGEHGAGPQLSHPDSRTAQPSDGPQPQFQGSKGAAALAKYMVCIEQCAVASLPSRPKRSIVTCAVMLGCGMQPPDEGVQKAYMECYQAMNVGTEPPRDNCQCLKDSGLEVDCSAAQPKVAL